MRIVQVHGHDIRVTPVGELPAGRVGVALAGLVGVRFWCTVGDRPDKLLESAVVVVVACTGEEISAELLWQIPANDIARLFEAATSGCRCGG